MAVKVKILCVGAIKHEFLKDACKEYIKMLSRYAKVEVCQVKDQPLYDNMSEKEISAVLDKEGERLLQKTPKDETVIALCIDGEKVDSNGLSKKLDDYLIKGSSKLTFIIGSSFGLSENVIKRANWTLSFSDLTFPHQLMRVVLLEQVYRAFSIRANSPYHK